MVVFGDTVGGIIKWTADNQLRIRHSMAQWHRLKWCWRSNQFERISARVHCMEISLDTSSSCVGQEDNWIGRELGRSVGVINIRTSLGC